MHSHIASPSSWAPEIVSRIASIVADTASDASSQTQCLSGMLGTCKSWHDAAQRHISMHMYLDMSTTLLSAPTMGPKTVEIVATFNQVASGMFAEKLKEQFPLRNTKKMTLSIESGESLEHGSDQDTTIGAISNEHIRKLAVGFALSLIRTFPNIQTLCFHSSPDSSPIHCMYSTYAYSLLAGYANAHPHCSLKTFIGYHIYGNMLSTPDIPVIHGGLTHLSLGKIVWNEDGIIEAAHRNASTLKMLSVTYARTTQVLGLVVDAEGQQVVYPELVKLTLGVCNGVPMEIREICPFNPFPKLQHLSIPGAFPFANGNMLNSKKLKTLVLAVSNHSLKTLKHTAVFSGRRKLQYVDIRTLPVEDPALFPMVESSESNVLSEANSVLCQEFVLNTVSSEPFSKARLNLGSSLDASGFISRLPDGCNISELDLGLSTLTLCQATDLITALPRLEHLKYTLPSTEESTNAGTIIAHNKLEQITVTSKAPTDTCSIDAEYLAHLCFRVRSLLKLNVYSNKNCRNIISERFWQKLADIDPSFAESPSSTSLLRFEHDESPNDPDCIFAD